MWEDIFYTEEEISYLLELMKNDGEIKHLPKLSEDDCHKYQLEFIKRYRFLYENSFFILGCLMNFYSLSGHILLGNDDPFLDLKKEISEKVGISNHYYYFGESMDFFYLIEEAFFGEGPVEFMELYRIIDAIKEKSTLFPDLKIRFSHDDGLAFSERDKSFKILLETVKCFINSHDSNTQVYNNGVKSATIWKHLPDKKLDLFGVYYDVFNYGLTKMGVFEESLKYDMDFYSDKKESRTNVGGNPFLSAFSKDYLLFYQEKEVVSIPLDLKKKLYYDYHNVLDWDYEEECREDSSIERPRVTKACGMSFQIKEGSIFFYEDNFYHLCPNCFYIVKLNKESIPEVIGNRIRKRCSDDDNLLKKYSLLSELKHLEQEGKVLSKK